MLQLNDELQWFSSVLSSLGEKEVSKRAGENVTSLKSNDENYILEDHLETHHKGIFTKTFAEFI